MENGKSALCSTSKTESESSEREGGRQENTAGGGGVHVSDTELLFKHGASTSRQQYLRSLLEGDEMARIRQHRQNQSLRDCFDEKTSFFKKFPAPSFSHFVCLFREF